MCFAAGIGDRDWLFPGSGNPRAKQPQEDDPCPHPVGPAGTVSSAHVSGAGGRPATRAITVCAAGGALW